MKKILLLASMALALGAFAAPAAQATAPEWYHEGETLQGEEELHMLGEIAFNVVGSGFVAGPCEITFEGTAENVNGMAHGTINGGTIDEECGTNEPKCTITPTPKNLPWTLTGITVTGVPGVEIQNATFTNHHMGQCPVPAPSIPMAGTITGIVDAEGCVSLEGHLDDLFLEPPFPPSRVNLLGGFCDTTLDLA